MKKVFLSYSRADYVDKSGQVLENSQVEAIIDALNATNKIDIWIDINAKYSGKYFTSVLAKKILWADKVLFLSSKNSNDSEWVSKEILFAYDNNKDILPVRLDGSNYNVDIAIILTGIDYIEYFKSPKQKLTDIIENILGDSQEISDVNETLINALTDSSVSNQKERKGCLSLNVNFRGCALSMTIAMCLFMVFGLFFKVKEKKELIALNEARQSVNYDSFKQNSERQAFQEEEGLEDPMREKKEPVCCSPRHNGNVMLCAIIKGGEDKDQSIHASEDSLAVQTENDSTYFANNTNRVNNDSVQHLQTDSYLAHITNEKKDEKLETHPILNICDGHAYMTPKMFRKWKKYRRTEKSKKELRKHKISNDTLRTIIYTFMRYGKKGTYISNIIEGPEWNVIMGTHYGIIATIELNKPQCYIFINKINSMARHDSVPVLFRLPDLSKPIDRILLRQYYKRVCDTDYFPIYHELFESDGSNKVSEFRIMMDCLNTNN